MWIAIAVIVIAAVGGVAFYAGRHNAQQDAMRPIAQRAAGGPAFTRLPPTKYGNWTLLCVLDPRQTKHCSLVFQAVDTPRRHLRMRIGVMRTARGRVAMAIITPPNALVAAGVKLTPGNNPAVTVPFLRCMPRACQASVVVTDPLLTSLSGSDSTQVSFVAGTGKPVSYKLPTQGFKEGYAAWLAESPAPPASATAVETAAPPEPSTVTPPAPATTPVPAKRKVHAPALAPKEPPATP
jgi:invasion protein IalB